jgi:hypothetical protein
MEQIKLEKGEAFAVIAYHYSDEFDLANGVLEARYQYYRPGGMAFPFAVMDGAYQALGGTQPGGTMYPNYLLLYNQRIALSPPVDISLSLEAANQVRVQVTNISSSQKSGNLHIALVERYRPNDWKDMHVVDFVLRNMLTGSNGQRMTLGPSASSSSVQQFSVQAGWNYCSIIAFFQTDDKQIQQGAMLALEDTIPAIQVLDPVTGAALQPGSTQAISWSINRPLPYVSIKYSTDAGQNWTTIQSALSGATSFNWTVPYVTSAQCLISIQDPFGEAQAVSGLFAIGHMVGDFNADSLVNSADRNLLIEHLVENNATQLSGADLNEDGAVDLFDLIYFDASLVP